MADRQADLEVLFVCVRNAGRSQMAAALLDRYGHGRVRARSAGSDPADAVHPEVVTAMREVGIDLSGEVPKALTSEMLDAADVVVTMGCGDACPVVPSATYLDWDLQDPAGLPLDEVRSVRDQIDHRVRALLDQLVGRRAGTTSSR